MRNLICLVVVLFYYLVSFAGSGTRYVDGDVLRLSDHSKQWFFPTSASGGTLSTGGGSVTSLIQGAGIIFTPSGTITSVGTIATNVGASAPLASNGSSISINYLPPLSTSGGSLSLSFLSPFTTTNGSLALSTVGITNGGTGLSSIIAAGNFLFSNGTSYIPGTLAAGSGITLAVANGTTTISTTGGSGTVTSIAGTNGVVTNPSGGITGAGTLSVNLSQNPAGTLAIGSGGTGQTTANAAYTALTPATAKAAIATSNGTTAVALPAGSFGQIPVANTNTTTGLEYRSPLYKNYVINPSCGTLGTSFITVTAGTISQNTTNPLDSQSDCALAPTATGGKYSWSLNAFDNSLTAIAKNCEAKFDYTGTATNFKAYVAVNGTTQIATLRGTLDSSGIYDLNFPCPSSGTSTLNIEATAATTGTVNVANLYVGPQTNIGGVSNITEWKACASVGAGTLWTSTGTSPVYGTSASANNFQGIKCFWRRNGENAEIQFDYHQTTAGTLPSGMGLFNLNAVDPSIVIDQNRIKLNTNTNVTIYANLDSAQPAGYMATSAGYAHNLYAVPHGTLGTQVKFHMSYTGPTQGGLILGNTSSWFDQTEMSMGLRMSFPVVGWNATAGAVRSDQTNNGWTSYTPTFGGLGTPTAVDFRWKRDGEDMIIQGRLTTGTVTAATASISLPNGMTIGTNKISGTQAIGQVMYGAAFGAYWHTLGVAGSNAVNIGKQDSGNAGNSLQLGTTFASTTPISVTARIPIDQWSETQNAPVQIGGFTSGATGSIRIESAKISSTGVVTELSGSDWINGNCSVSTSTFTCTLTTGYFVSAPSCFTLANSGNGDNGYGNSFTTTQIQYTFTRPGAGNFAVDHFIMCIGQRN